MKLLIKHFLSLVLTLFIFFGFISCGDDDDPCTDAKPFKASFKMGMKVDLGGITKPKRFDTLLVSDTVRNNRPTTFIAKKGYLSYHWTIGDFHKNFTTREVSLRIANPDRIKIQLIAKKKPNLRCFPKDDGIDTVVQYLTVIRVEDNPIIGKYRGHLKSAPDKEFDVEIKHEIGKYEHKIHNLNNGCWPYVNNSYVLRNMYSAYKSYCFSPSDDYNDYYNINSCLDPRGMAVLDKSGKNIKIRFSTGDEKYRRSREFSLRKHHIFIGKKIK